MYDPYAKFKKITLGNGLEIHFQYRNVPWCAVTFVVHSGPKDDPKNKKGLAHFVEHCVSEGFPGVDRETIDLAFERRGGTVDFGETIYTNSTYSFVVPLERRELQDALNLFGILLLQSDITAKLQQERKAVTNEYYEEFGTGRKKRRVQMRRHLLFRNHHLGSYVRPVGNITAIKRMTATDIKEFYRRHYTPQNISLVVLGGITKKKLVRMIEQSPFSKKKSGARSPLPRMITKMPLPKKQRLTWSVKKELKRKVSQSMMEIYAALPGTMNERVIDVACAVLNRTLLRIIRNSGWSYGFQTTYRHFPEGFEIEITGTFPWSGLKKIEQLVDQCFSEAQNDRDGISKTISAAINGFKIVSISELALVQHVAESLGTSQRNITMNEERARTKAVTVEAVRQLLNVISKRRVTTIAYP